MQLLCVHAERFGFEARNPDPGRETVADQTEAELASAVVVFVAVEAGDTHSPATTTREAADTVGSVTDQLKTTQIGLVPCRQLTDSPADRERAGTVLDRLAATLTEDGGADQPELARVPTGWDVALDIETKAHPHAVQHFVVEPDTDAADSEWLCYSDGTLRDHSAVSLDAETAAVLEWERGDAAPAAQDSLAVGSGFGLFELGADDSCTLQPRGVLARDLLAAYVSDTLADYGAVPVDRLGTHDRSVFHRQSISDDAFPVRLFEPRTDPPALADGSLPAATVPELSALVADLPGAFAEACEQAALIHRLWAALELSYEPVLRVRGDAVDRYGDHVAALASTVGQPVLVERRPTADWLLKLDFRTLSAGEPSTTPTVLIDDAAGDDLVPEDTTADPMVVRSLPAGAIERTLGAILAQRGGLPEWLAPVQFRLVPIDPSAHLAYCDQLADRLQSVRTDIDDRDIAVRERLVAADDAAIPYYAVIGDDELDSDQIGVIVRDEDTERDLSLAQLRTLFTDAQIDRRAASPLPRYLSELPAQFV